MEPWFTLSIQPAGTGPAKCSIVIQHEIAPERVGYMVDRMTNLLNAMTDMRWGIETIDRKAGMTFIQIPG